MSQPGPSRVEKNLVTELRPGVLFDVDGTLVDTNYLHTLAWSRALDDAGEWAPMHAIHRLVGMGGDRLVPELLGRSDEEVTSARDRHYWALTDEIRAFPGAAALLHRAQRDLAVVLATSSPKDELDVVLDLLGARGAIDAQTTADDVEESKPAPDVFRAAMEAGRVDPHRAIAVGDSTWDIEGARAAGIACIGLESGGFSRHELSEAGAIAVYRDAEELLEQFDTSPLGPLAAS
jgi:HAD superfamily hydrolase (TIGR01509 family)